MAQEILYNRHYEKQQLLLHIVKNAVCYFEAATVTSVHLRATNVGPHRLKHNSYWQHV
jgi:hypothetical protein